MIYIVVVLGSFALYLIVGAVAGTRVKNNTDYFLAGRKAPTLLITGSLVASFFSTTGFTGDVGLSYDGYPILLLIIQTMAYAGYVLGVLMFGRYLRRSRALTIPEFFGERFDSEALRIVAGASVVVGIGAYLVAVTQGLGILMSNLFDIGYGVSVVIVWVSYTVFTVLGGSPGVLITDTIMFLVFASAGVIGMIWIVGHAGGPGEVAATLSGLEAKPDALAPHGLTGPESYLGSPTEALIWAIVFGLVWFLVIAVSPWQSSRYMMARNEHVAIRSAAVAAVALLIIEIFVAFGALSINAIASDIDPSSSAFIWAARNILPVWLGALILAGIAAAGLSSASTFLSLVGFSTAHDIARVWRRPARATKSVESVSGTGFSRAVMAITGLVVLAVSFLTPPAIFEITLFAGTLFAASWGPIALVCMRSSRVTSRGALLSLTFGFTTVVTLELSTAAGWIALPVYFSPPILGFAAAIAGLTVGSIGQRPPAKGLAFRESILPTPATDVSETRTRNTLRFVTFQAVAAIAMVLLLIVVYAWPYATAT